MHCQGTACIRTFNMGLTSAEGQKLECFKRMVKIVLFLFYVVKSGRCVISPWISLCECYDLYGCYIQCSWSKGVSETNLKLKIPCRKCMHWPVTSQANACTSHSYPCMYCLPCPMTSQADACSYCMDSVVSISSQIYLYLQLLCVILTLIALNESAIHRNSFSIHLHNIS